jgi:hypothetical protein
MRIYYIYGLVDPVSHLVRYVGQTVNLDARYRVHSFGKDHCTGEWVRSLSQPPALILLESGEQRDIPRPRKKRGRASDLSETKWLKRFRRTVINKKLRDNCPAAWDQLTNPEGRV